MKLIKFVISAICLVLTSISVSAKEFVVVIDAGHGGSDYGAVGKNSTEKSINLAVAKKLGTKISDNLKDVKVVYTRDDDSFVSLKERANRANKAKGDLFISIHVNSVAKRSRNRNTVAGSEVYTLGLHKSEENLAVAKRENAVIALESDYSETYRGFDPNSIESYIIFELSQSKHLDQSIEFAAAAQKELTTTARRADKGVKQAGFWVLWATGMPAVLVELDFICNPNSEAFLASSDGQDKLATALYNAFRDYTNAQPKNGKPNADTENKTKSRNDDDDDEKASTATGNQADRQSVVNHDVGEDFRIQILASDKKLKSNSPQFKGLTDVEEYFDNGMYKYTVGHATDSEQAKKILKKARRTHPQAFIIRMVDGKRAR